MNLFRHLVGLLGRGSARLKAPTHATQHRKTQTNIHAPSGIRTPVFERSKTVRALDSAAIGTGIMTPMSTNI